MAPEERTKRLFASTGTIRDTELGQFLVTLVIKEAIAEERAACLAIVETYGEENGHMDGLAEAIAGAIRHRGG